MQKTVIVNAHVISPGVDIIARNVRDMKKPTSPTATPPRMAVTIDVWTTSEESLFRGIFADSCV